MKSNNAIIKLKIAEENVCKFNKVHGTQVEQLLCNGTTIKKEYNDTCDKYQKNINKSQELSRLLQLDISEKLEMDSSTCQNNDNTSSEHIATIINIL